MRWECQSSVTSHPSNVPSRVLAGDKGRRRRRKALRWPIEADTCFSTRVAREKIRGNVFHYPLGRKTACRYSCRTVEFSIFIKFVIPIKSKRNRREIEETQVRDLRQEELEPRRFRKVYSCRFYKFATNVTCDSRE